MTRLRRIEDASASPFRTESVDRAALSPGDHVLVVPEEQAGVDGRITNATLSAADLPDGSWTVQGDVVVEDADGERRPARAGGRIGAGETVRGGPVVVRVGRPALVPWLRSAVGLSGPIGGSPRLIAVVLVVVLALVGAGIGGFDPAGSDAGAGPTSTTPTEPTPPPTPTAPPTVTATPPAPATDGSGTTSDGQTPTRGSDGRIALSVTDPDDVRQRDGRPRTVSAALSGSVEADSRADSMVVVVQSWVPGQGWATVARADTAPDTVTLADRFGEVVLASGDRAAGFHNSRDGTTAEFRGQVAVTAVMFDGGVEIGRLSATDGYTLRVTNLAAASADLVLGDGEATGSLFGDDGLRSGDDSAGTDPGVLAPGSSGSNSLAITNRGSGAGTLTLSSVSYVSVENGRTGPESSVDATGGDPGRGAGELHEALELRLAIERADGSREWVFGSATEFGSVEALAADPVDLGRLAAGERVELVVDYRLPASVGNEIQTDSIVVDVSFTLATDD